MIQTATYTTNERAAGQDEIDRLLGLAKAAKDRGETDEEARHLAEAQAVWKDKGGFIVYGCTFTSAPNFIIT